MGPVHDSGSMDPVQGGVHGPLDHVLSSPVANYNGGRGVRGFSWKRLCLCGQLVTRKGPKQALCRI